MADSEHGTKVVTTVTSVVVPMCVMVVGEFTGPGTVVVIGAAGGVTV